jgi:hypothetical protein
MDQHLKNTLAMVIAFASATMFLVLVVRLKGRAAETERPRTGKYSLDGPGRRIAGGCSFVAAAVALFWLLQRFHGAVPKGDLVLVDMIITYSSLGALCFGLVGIRRELSNLTVNGPAICTLISLIWAVGLALESYIYGAPDVARAGLVTVAVIVGLAFVYALVGKRLRPKAAQPAVAADGGSPH